MQKEDKQILEFEKSSEFFINLYLAVYERRFVKTCFNLLDKILREKRK